MIDLQAIPTQAQFGELVGISQPAVSGLVSRGVLRDGDSAAGWLLAYCEHLREIAAGRGGDQVGELAAERAALAREQRIKIAMQNAVTRGDLAPKRLLSDVLARALSRIARLLDTIPGELRRRSEALTADDIEAVRRVIAKVRNICAATTIDDLSKSDDEADGADGLEQDAELEGAE